MISKQKAADILGLKLRTIEYFMYNKWEKGVHWYPEGRIVFVDMKEDVSGYLFRVHSGVLPGSGLVEIGGREK